MKKIGHILKVIFKEFFYEIGTYLGAWWVLGLSIGTIMTIKDKSFAVGFKSFFWVGLIVCVVKIITIIIAVKNHIEYERSERERVAKEAVDKAYNDWTQKLNNLYRGIEKNISSLPSYDSILKMNIPNIESRYQAYYIQQKERHINYLRSLLPHGEEEIKSHRNLRYKICVLKCLKKIDTNGSKYDPAIRSLEKLYADGDKKLLYIKNTGYGSFQLPLENPEEMEYLEKNAGTLLRELQQRVTLLKGNNLEKMYLWIEKCFQEDYLEEACRLLWYYAWKKPFDVNCFMEAEKLYAMSTRKNIPVEENIKEIKSIENILAKIYSKNQLGGLSMVRQEMEEINIWLQLCLNQKDAESCVLLASGFAWMELYDLELEVLRKCVEYNVQLPEEVQERLAFLESGGTSNVKVYEVESKDEFLYDSTAVDWKQKDFEVLFRKATMKKIPLNYAFAITNWTKTLPLAAGQKVSTEAFYDEFEKMIKDFEGEATCRKVMARAVNLENVEHENAVLFTFLHKRNRCGSMLFSSEKFGRNLNLTIITMFTPEADLNDEEHMKYIQALKENIYIDSFRESILQSVDSVLKEKKTVYDEEEEVVRPKHIVE